MSTPVAVAVAPPTAPRAAAPGLRVALRWELVKLFGLRRVQLLVVLLVVLPLTLIAVLALQASSPTDSLYGRWVHTSGYATGLVVLGFAGQWVLPLLVAVVAGDLISAEDHHGTWRTVLTRSIGRTPLVAAKVAVAGAWTVLVVVVLGLSTTVGGLLLVGAEPLPGLDGAPLSGGRLAGRVFLAWGCQLAPALGFAALALLASAVSRSSAVGIGVPAVLGLALQLIGLVPAAQAVRPFLLTSGFDAWHGVLAGQVQLGPLALSGTVSLTYLVAALGALLVVVSATSMDRD